MYWTCFFLFVHRALIWCAVIAMLASLQKTHSWFGTYRFTHSIVPARLSVCKLYIQLNRSSSRGGGYPRRWCHCARAVGSGSGSAWLNEKLSGLYIRGHRGVLVMQNSHTNWISPGDASLSFMKLSPVRVAPRRECLTWHLGIKVVSFARLADEDLLVVALSGNGPRQRIRNCEISPSVCYGETGLSFISRTI